MVGTIGTQECGGFYKEERFRVTGCYVALEANMPLTVRVWTSLDEDASDESFGIDNFVVRSLGKGYPVKDLRSHGRQTAMKFTHTPYVQKHAHIHAYHTQVHVLIINEISRAGTAAKSLHATGWAIFAAVTMSRARGQTSKRRSTCLRAHTRWNSTSSKSIPGACARWL